MASAADIIVNLVAKTARFERGINRANRRLGTMAKAARTTQFAIKSLAAGILTLGAGRLAGAARQQLQLAANLERVANTVGFTTTEIQELRFAAEQLQVTQQTLDLGLQRFSRRLGEAAQNTGELLTIANQYGVVLRDSQGNIRSNSDLLGDFADIISRTTDEQEQLRIAFKLFDSEGASLVQLLRQGRDGIAAFRAEANELGVVVDADLIQKAAAAEREVDKLASVLRAKMLVAVAENIDPMLELAEATSKVATFSLDAAAATSRFAEALGEQVAALVVGAADGMDLLIEQIRETERVVNRVESPLALFTGGFTDEEVQAAEKRLEFLNAAFDQFLLESAQEFNRRVAEARQQANELEALTPTPTQTPQQQIGRDITGVNEVDITETLLRVNQVMKDRQRIAQLIQQTRTREEVILNNIRFINGEIAKGEANQNQLIEVRGRLFDELQDALDKNLDAMSELEEFGVQAARNMQTAMADFIAGSADGFDGLLQNFRNLLIRMVAELLARRILLSFLGGIAGGSGPFAELAGDILGGISRRQLGGPLSSGQPAIVGESGPELFIPNQAGRVLPNRRGMGTTVVINQTNNFNSEGALNPEDLVPLLEENGRKVKAELIDELDRGAFA